MTIKYIPEGDLFRASQLWGEGRHQLSILKNAISFQNLKQDQRLVRFADGTIIKCWSCFGQDVVNIFVPQVFVGGEPEYREREEVTYYPAIEVYDSPYWTATYLGIVICKGGGFKPPYEFIPKDALPEDTHTEPLGELPKERIWDPETNRMLQDIVPMGIADAEVAVAKDPAPTISASGVYKGLITRAERTWYESSTYVDCWEYRARSAANYAYSRTEHLRLDYVFSYALPGESDPGDWPEYFFEGRWCKYKDKPLNILRLDGGTYWDIYGNGNNNFHQDTAPFDYSIHKYAMKFVVDYILFGVPVGHWERDDENVNFTSIIDDAIAQSESHFATYGDPANATFPEFESGAKRGLFYKGDYDYSYLDDFRGVWDQYASIMDGDFYALVYSMYNFKKQAHCYRKISDLAECLSLPYYDVDTQCLGDARVEDIMIDEHTEGPLYVVVDGIIFELFPEAALEVSPRLQRCSLKYFRVGDKSIGLFRIGKNYGVPMDYSYVYAEVMHPRDKDISNPKHVITEVIDLEVADAQDAPQIIGGDTVRFSVKTNAGKLSYMKDLDGNTLYGKDGIRLIKETIVVKEMATAEQPGLFRKII